MNVALLMERVPELGLVIDLTDTNRHYDPREFKNYGVEFKKIPVSGRKDVKIRKHCHKT